MARVTFGKAVLLRKTSLVDYPPYLSAVIFFPGCNLRCPWCHNRELVLDGALPGGSTISLEDALVHIEKRRGVLGGVVLSGGEPTLFPGLGETARRVKALGLKVKLDTNGTRPDVLETLFGTAETRPDYTAIDLKLAPERYAGLLPAAGGRAGEVFGGLDPGEALQKSAALVRASGVEHEFRSLALPAPDGAVVPYFGKSDIAALKPLAGDSPWHIRPFVPGNCLDPAWNSFF